MMAAAIFDPGFDPILEVRLHVPKYAGHRQFWSRNRRFEGRDFVNQQFVVCPEVSHGNNYAFAGFTVKYETCRIFAIANPKWGHDDFWLVARQRRINFKHVGLQNRFLTCCHLVGVVFHETGVFVMSHHFQQTVKRSRFPVAFAGESVALGHQTLNGQTR
ncbi:hypothetical protein D1872_276990 [compost metagenome]